MLPLSFWLISIGMLVLYSGERFGSSLLLTLGICLFALVLLTQFWKWRRQISQCPSGNKRRIFSSLWGYMFNLKTV